MHEWHTWQIGPGLTPPVPRLRGQVLYQLVSQPDMAEAIFARLTSLDFFAAQCRVLHKHRSMLAGLPAGMADGFLGRQPPAYGVATVELSVRLGRFVWDPSGVPNKGLRRSRSHVFAYNKNVRPTGCAERTPCTLAC